jgi:exopolyphosphatase/guanosine-5'-triphosphate,3'-diphosphate pyrophosphatase
VRVAVVDLGSNTTRMLVADVQDGVVNEIDRRTKVTRLGEGVDSSGRLGDEPMQRVFETLATYREAIDHHGAERVVAVATSAVRDASNGEEFRSRLLDRFGIEARTISGDEEARLTFLGATSRRGDGDREPTLVLDIGGGSTEFVVGRPGGEPSFHVSTQAGSVRQTERHIHTDPPDPDEVAAVAEEVERIVLAEVPERVRAEVTKGIAVAGTATSLAAIDQALDPYDPAKVDGYRLELAACERILALLAELPLERRREVTGLHPDRAPTIVAGAVILIEAMRACGLEWMETSEADILHGAALAAWNGATSGK